MNNLFLLKMLWKYGKWAIFLLFLVLGSVSSEGSSDASANLPADIREYEGHDVSYEDGTQQEEPPASNENSGAESIIEDDQQPRKGDESLVSAGVSEGKERVPLREILRRMMVNFETSTLLLSILN